MDALRRDKDRAGAFELVGVMCSNLIMGGCGCERCGSGVGMRGELIAARSSLVHGAARGVCRLLAVHGAVMRTVTPATTSVRFGTDPLIEVSVPSIDAESSCCPGGRLPPPLPFPLPESEPLSVELFLFRCRRKA